MHIQGPAAKPLAKNECGTTLFQDDNSRACIAKSGEMNYRSSQQFLKVVFSPFLRI